MKRVVQVVGVMLLLMALYSFAGTSDRMDSLTAQQQAAVVSRWGE